MKFVSISDTHGLHRQIIIPPADVLIHAGDVTMDGKKEEVQDFLDWFSGQPHRYKIFVAGNHDFFFDKAAPEEINAEIPDNLIYLNDSGVSINGVSIWGSPVQLWYMGWAFNRHKGHDIKKHWDLIPAKTDILLTHSPPSDIMDELTNGVKIGSEELKEKVFAIQPKVHVFGHAHEGYGEQIINGIRFINACNLDYQYKVANAPIVFEL